MKETGYHKTGEELKTEMALVNAAKSNPDLFAPLYDKYYRSIFLFIFRRTENEELTADMTQHVFIAAMINLKRYEFKGVPFSAWLYRIALNEVSAHYRKQKKERTVSIEQNDIRNIFAEVGESEDEARIQLLLQALTQLKEKEMQLVELRFFERHSFAEIAEITGISEGNAKVKMHRILEKLKIMLKGKI